MFFMKLDFVTIMNLVKENCDVTVDEDHFFMFVYKWLLHEESRQTSTNISKFLLGIWIKSCFNFLLDDKILNNWEEYPKWFVRMKKHFSTKEKISVNQTEGETGQNKRWK